MFTKRTWTIVAFVLLLIWIFVCMNAPLLPKFNEGINTGTHTDLRQGLDELESLKSHNEKLEVQDLRNILKELNVDENATELRPQSNHTMFGYETAEKVRRKIQHGVKEFWFYVRSELKKLKKIAGGNKTNLKKVDVVLDDGGYQERSIIADLYKLSKLDGSDDRLQKEAKHLSILFQRRLQYLQNPKTCTKARKLLCTIEPGCGFGCQLHYAAYCFVVAYRTGRTLILKFSGWTYATEWEKVLKPVSETCRDAGGSSQMPWGPLKTMNDSQVVSVTFKDRTGMHLEPDLKPLAIPEDLAPYLLRLHGNPAVWWIGQLLKYLLRPQPKLKKDMEKAEKRLGFTKPIVGVHVRRTDKLNWEAAFHGIEEYMFHVEEYFNTIEIVQPVQKRRVYLASDEPTVFDDARRKFPEYEFISDMENSKTAGLDSRYKHHASLRGTLLDIHFLAHSDFLVCTFSSNMCRLAYEIMQTLHPDASSYFRSVDEMYTFVGGHEETAIYKHKARRDDEIDMEPGDTIGVAESHWDGYSKGRNHRTGKNGLYPSYKTEYKTEIAKMPTYPEAGNLPL